MSFKFNDKIVTDGLVFCVDPANKNSYVSGSSVVYDIARTTSKGSTNTQFDSGSGGSFYLNNPSAIPNGQFILGTDSSNLLDVSSVGNVTIDMFVNPVNSGPTGHLFNYGHLGSGLAINVSYSIQINGTGIIIYNGITNSGRFGTNTLFSNVWNNITVVFSFNQQPAYYKNGNFVALSPSILNPSTRLNNYWYIGYLNGSSQPFNGKIGVTKVYNRALSASEIQQNFNAVRKRYNL